MVQGIGVEISGNGLKDFAGFSLMEVTASAEACTCSNAS